MNNNIIYTYQWLCITTTIAKILSRIADGNINAVGTIPRRATAIALSIVHNLEWSCPWLAIFLGLSENCLIFCINGAEILWVMKGEFCFTIAFFEQSEGCEIIVWNWEVPTTEVHGSIELLVIECNEDTETKMILN